MGYSIAPDGKELMDAALMEERPQPGDYHPRPILVTPTNFRPTFVPLEYLNANPYQPREMAVRADDPKFEQLVQSIRQHGFSGIFEARTDPADPFKYQLVYGERRREACKRAGLKVVPVQIQDRDDRAMMAMAHLENATRQEPTPYEQGRLFRRMADEGNLTIREIANVTGENKGYVQARWDLTRAPESLLDAARDPALMTVVLLLMSEVFTDDERKMYLQAVKNGEVNTADIKSLRKARNATRAKQSTQPLPGGAVMHTLTKPNGDPLSEIDRYDESDDPPVDLRALSGTISRGIVQSRVKPNGATVLDDRVNPPIVSFRPVPDPVTDPGQRLRMTDVGQEVERFVIPAHDRTVFQRPQRDSNYYNERVLIQLRAFVPNLRDNATKADLSLLNDGERREVRELVEQVRGLCPV